MASAIGISTSTNRQIADAHRDNGKRFVVRADEKLTAFVELESATRGQRDGFLGKGVFPGLGSDVLLKS